jgi:signal transduction histidine kinase
MMDHLPEGIAIKSTKKFEYANDSIKKILGISDNEENAVANGDTCRHLPNQRSQSSDTIETNDVITSRFQNIKNDNGSLYDFLQESDSKEFKVTQYHFQDKDKLDRHFEACAKTIQYEGGDCKFVTVKDLTMSIQLERELISKKYEKVFLASFTHELVTPLNGLLGLLEFLEKSITTPEIKFYVDTAQSTGILLLYLIQDVIEIYKMGSNCIIQLNESWVNTRELVEECRKLLMFGFEQKNIEFIIDIDNNTPELLYADRVKYRQILINLVGNALKYTMKGNVTLSLKYNAEEKKLISSVKDTGIGISEENITKLFKLFGKVEENCGLNPQGAGASQFVEPMPTL